MKQLTHLLLLIAILGVSCKTTKQAYEKGDYETAVFNSIERLRKSPKNKKSRQTLHLAYPTLVDELENRIDLQKRGSDPLKWEFVAKDYKLLNRVYSEIRRSPAAMEVIPNPINFTNEYNQTIINAADARYALGMKELNKGRNGDREASKQAYTHFQKAQDWQHGFRDAEALQTEAQDLATIIIEIAPIPMHSRTFELTNEFFESQLSEYIATAPLSPFVRFFTPEQTSRMSREPDQILKMQFDDFVVGQAYVKETVLQRKKEDVVVGEVQVTEDSVADVYGDVEAEVHRFHKEISSSGLLDVQIIDNHSGSLMSQRKFPGTFVWVDRWGYFNGDKRALESEDQTYCRKRNEAPAPPPQDLFIEFTKPIFSQVTGFVSDYYRGY
ncbi:MAG: hypothetical protein AAF587_36845 [Bacteroidota bacterium]